MVDPTVDVGMWPLSAISGVSTGLTCLDIAAVSSLALSGLRGQLGRSVTADLKEEPTEDGGKPPYDLDLVFEQHLTPVSGSHRRVL